MHDERIVSGLILHLHGIERRQVAGVKLDGEVSGLHTGIAAGNGSGGFCTGGFKNRGSDDLAVISDWTGEDVVTGFRFTAQVGEVLQH